MEYLVKAVDAKGRDQHFVVDADDPKSAAAAIRARGFFPFEVAERLRAAKDLVPAPPAPTPKEEPAPAVPPAAERPLVYTCHACNGTVAKELKKCPHCGATRKPTPEEQFAGNIAGIGCLVALLVWVIFISHSCSTTPSRTYSSSPAYTDPRDQRWANPAGREVIRAMAEEAGVGEAEMRRSVNDELDRRGLSDWADGKE